MIITPEEIRKEYSYLERLNHEGWLWEFIRHNEEYQKQFDILSKIFPQVMFNVEGDYFGASDMKIISDNETLNMALKHIESAICIKPNGRIHQDKDHYLVAKPDNVNMYFGYPNYRYHYGQIIPKPVITGIRPVTTATFKDDVFDLTEDKLNAYCRKVINKISPAGMQDTLYIGIPLYARKDELMKTLSNLIDDKINDKKSIQNRFKEWRRYIIFRRIFNDYDSNKRNIMELECKEYSKEQIYIKIAELFNTAYPDEFVKPSNVKTGLRQITNLIDKKGYKAYLHL